MTTPAVTASAQWPLALAEEVSVEHTSKTRPYPRTAITDVCNRLLQRARCRLMFEPKYTVLELLFRHLASSLIAKDVRHAVSRILPKGLQ
jgi:hypothetical protein